MISKKKLKISFGYGQTPNKTGVFFTYIPNVGIISNIYSCRESFECYFQHSRNWIGFRGSAVDIKAINNFFTTIENRLNLKDKTEFFKTNDNYTIIAKVPVFWSKNNVRRGFFTLFLRCAAAYSSGLSISQAIDAYPLARKIKGAINWFLDGHTEIANSSIQYGSTVDTLHGMDNMELSRFLIIKKNQVKKKGYQRFMGDIGILKLARNER